MGRSVMTVPDATATAFDTFLDEEVECWECQGSGTVEEDAFTCDTCQGTGEVFEQDESGEIWRIYLDWVSERARELWPSFEDADYWIGREVHVVAQNAHSVVAVAEYCGVVSISLAPRYDRRDFWQDPSEIAGIGEHWRKQISDKFLDTFGEMTKIGTFSDGTSAYKKRGA